MPTISIEESPLAPKVTPIEIHYRETGNGPPLIFLHGGWGYEIYPFDSQIEAFGNDYRIIIPDRTGYGRSLRISEFPIDFHQRAAREVKSFIEALGIDRPILWGHSDGAVIAVLMALSDPDRYSALILEAFHFYKSKPGSREFFETMAKNPDGLGARVSAALAADHGEEYWRELIINNGRAWLDIAVSSNHEYEDLYGGRLGRLRTPAIFIHGSRDPRTEPGELDAVRDQLSDTPIHIIEGGGHSPHSESLSAKEANRIAGDFLNRLAGDRRA
ncbi:MAG TPA: alpha/beta hydrolase [Blastocatellia bacterium]|nr:alpha/beta hydrolase [Blastocatellia bacterium]